MGENSGKNSAVRALEVEGAHDGDRAAKVDHGNHDHGDDEVLMKRMISSHPLFELLIGTHINCLKMGLGHDFKEEEEEEEEAIRITANSAVLNDEGNGKLNESSSDDIPTTPELDKFMEAYCMALKRLKEAMEEPLKDTKSFINNMYAQLDDLSVTENDEEHCSTSK